MGERRIIRGTARLGVQRIDVEHMALVAVGHYAAWVLVVSRKVAGRSGELGIQDRRARAGVHGGWLFRCKVLHQHWELAFLECPCRLLQSYLQETEHIQERHYNRILASVH